MFVTSYLIASLFLLQRLKGNMSGIGITCRGARRATFHLSKYLFELKNNICLITELNRRKQAFQLMVGTNGSRNIKE